MWIDTAHPANALLLRHYALRKSPIIAPPSSVSDPYWNCGSHPDVVERVWDQLGSVLFGSSSTQELLWCELVALQFEGPPAV
jgi:hypothetical protein